MRYVMKWRCPRYQPIIFIFSIQMTQIKEFTNEELDKSQLKKKDQEANPVAAKKLYEHHWRLLLLFIVIVSSVLMKKLYDFQTLPLFENARKGSVSDLLIYGVPVMIIFTILDHAVHYFDDWFMVNYINEAKYPDIEKRKKRCYTFTKWVFSEFYYLPCSIWAYFLLKDTTYMPGWLGGSGSTSNVTNYFTSFEEATDEMKYFYVLQFGKHFSRFFSHVFIRAEGNFYEYALHHGLSTFLILFSFLSNMWFIGVMVLLFHDITDFGLIICRMYRDYKYRKEWVLKIIDYSMAPVWFSGRIFFFAYGCVWAGIQGTLNNFDPSRVSPEVSQTIFWLCVFMTFMMICLQGLQIFWTYYIFSSFLAVQITSKVKHTYD